MKECEHFLLGPRRRYQDHVLGENAWDKGAHSKFALINTPRGKERGRDAEVADAARFAEAARSKKVTDAKHAWNSRDLILIYRMEDNLGDPGEKSERWSRTCCAQRMWQAS